MAIFHLCCKAIQRRAGRSAVAAAAYRAAIVLQDERTGMTHDFQKKRGCCFRAVVAPSVAPEWVQDRQQLWNRAEAAEKREDSCTAHEIEVALPAELSDDERAALATNFARHVSNKFGGVVVDVCIHQPQQKKPRNGEKQDPSKGDFRNFHAHMLVTERKIESDGFAKKKSRHWNVGQGKDTVESLRADYAAMCNNALADYGTSVDHRSNKRRGIAAAPTTHQGPALTAMQRRRHRLQDQQKALEAAIAARQAPCPPVAVDTATGALVALSPAVATRSRIDPLEEINRYQPQTLAAAAERDLPVFFEAPLFSPFAVRHAAKDDEDEKRQRYEETRRRIRDAAPEMLDRSIKRTEELFDDDAPDSDNDPTDEDNPDRPSPTPAPPAPPTW